MRAVLLAVVLAACLQAGHAKPAKRVFAWAGHGAAGPAQLLNNSWRGLLDGVHAFCGTSFTADGSAVVANLTQLKGCDELKAASKQTGMQFHMCLGTIPDGSIENPEPVIRSAVALAKQHGWQGYNIDDESHCAPRNSLHNLTGYVGFIDKFAAALHAEGMELSADIQAIFGVQNCSIPGSCTHPKEACAKAPWEYSPDPRVAKLLSDSKIDRWIPMDTYYFTTARFLNALDWHVDNIALDKLGMGMMNRADINLDGWVSRFHALSRSGVTQLDVFILPMSDEFLIWLWRWKTDAAHCPNGGALSAYEPSVDCLPPHARQVKAAAIM